MSEFKDVLHSLRSAVVTRTRQMSLGLGLCVCVLVVGVGTMMLATIRRHQLTLQAIVYSSIGSLKKIRKKSTNVQEDKENSKENNKKDKKDIVDSESVMDINKEITTTTTGVAFFPRYSVVNKSQRGDPRSVKDKEGSETVIKARPINDDKVQESVRTKSKAQAGTIYEIFSTLKFKARKKPEMLKEKQQISEKHAKTTSSFYYESSSGDSSSKYDLTLARPRQVEAMVHRAAETGTKSVEDQSSPEAIVRHDKVHSSGEPLIGPLEDKVYTFRRLREKCRQMIAGSKPFRDNTRL